MTADRRLPLAPRAILLVLAALAALATACATDPSATAADPGAEVLAVAAGRPVTRAEAEARVLGPLRGLDQQRFELIHDAVRLIAIDRVKEELARERGITVDTLEAEEVAGRITPVTDADIVAFWEANKEQRPGRTLDELRGSIEQLLIDQRSAERRNQWLIELEERAALDFRLDPPRFPVVVPEGTAVVGKEDAPVTIVEFGDFQCPYCRGLHLTVNRLLTDYGDRVRYAFVDFPNARHLQAVPAAVAARCAGDQGRYWSYFDNLMLMRGPMTPDDLAKRAADSGLDVDSFRVCLDQRVHADAVRTSYEYGKELGVSRTPTFFINGRVLTGARDYETFRRIIDAELERAGSASAG